MRRFALPRKYRPLGDAKAVLLVRDGQGEVFEFHGVRQEAVGADHEIRLAAFHLLQILLRSEA
jgi:hypothetical protein